MSGLQIDYRISLGNILVVLGMIVSLAMGWANLSGRADMTQSSVAANKAAIASNEARVRALEQTSARQDERMILILESLRKIEQRLNIER